MRIGIVADTHGNTFAIEQVIRAGIADGVEAWLHLGDHARESTLFAERTGLPAYAVNGNCDAGDDFPEETVIELGGARIFMTHGHTFGVKYSRLRLAYRAEEAGCILALYGHTHVSMVEAHGPMLIVCPGSPSMPKQGRKPSYAIADISPSGDVDARIRLL